MYIAYVITLDSRMIICGRTKKNDALGKDEDTMCNIITYSHTLASYTNKIRYFFPIYRKEHCLLI